MDVATACIIRSTGRQIKETGEHAWKVIWKFNVTLLTFVCLSCQHPCKIYNKTKNTNTSIVELVLQEIVCRENPCFIYFLFYAKYNQQSIELNWIQQYWWWHFILCTYCIHHNFCGLGLGAEIGDGLISWFFWCFYYC